MENISSNLLPLVVRGKIVHGFGRGSKDLGIPTANMDEQCTNKLPDNLINGVYYGWAVINSGVMYKAVMSIGYNPFFKNERRSLEVHVIHKFQNSFYDTMLSVIIVGYIRQEKNYDNIDDLKSDIMQDIKFASEELDKEDNESYKSLLLNGCEQID